MGAAKMDESTIEVQITRGRAEREDAQRYRLLHEPWPESPAPCASVQARALRAAKMTMAATLAESTESMAVDYLASGWSSQACFRVHTRRQSVFVKVTSDLRQANLDALNDEHQAASWAHGGGLGPAPLFFSRNDGVLVSEFLPGGVLTANAALQRLDDVIGLLRRFHAEPIGAWQAPACDPIALANEQLAETLRLRVLPSSDAALIERATRRASKALAQAPAFLPRACHSDFHIQNIVLDDVQRMYVVDCEDAGSGDPMWDLGSLTANLATTGLIEGLDPLALAALYGAHGAEKARLRWHFELSLALYAGWTASRGMGWKEQHQAAMRELSKLEQQTATR